MIDEEFLSGLGNGVSPLEKIACRCCLATEKSRAILVIERYQIMPIPNRKANSMLAYPCGASIRVDALSVNWPVSQLTRITFAQPTTADHFRFLACHATMKAARLHSITEPRPPEAGKKCRVGLFGTRVRGALNLTPHSYGMD